MASKTAYILVRVPKSGSTSLQRMAASVLPDARVFETPESARTISSGVTLYEQMRNRRRRWRQEERAGRLKRSIDRIMHGWQRGRGVLKRSCPVVASGFSQEPS